jgi:stress-induced-phosphoprotein 1
LITVLITSFIVKAYIRKAAIEFSKKEYTKCLETCEAALKQDHDGQHAAEINKQMAKCRDAMWKDKASDSQESAEEALRKAASDPEIAVYIYCYFIINLLEDEFI